MVRPGSCVDQPDGHGVAKMVENTGIVWRVDGNAATMGMMSGRSHENGLKRVASGKGPEPNGWPGALICLLAIFAPSFLLVIGAMPFWDALRHFRLVQKALLGVNAAVVGLLLAALYHPVWTSGILSAGDFALALAAFTLLVFWRLLPWLVVLLSAAGGWGLAALS